MDKVIKLENVNQYNELYGLETLHPLVSVIDLTKATKTVNHIQMNYGLYALFLKESKSCDIKYGRQYYDYQEGTIVCFAPGQTAGVSTIEDEINPAVYGIIFHPDLIRGTSLGKDIKKYTFFSYAVNEALHLSDQEKEIVMDCVFMNGSLSPGTVPIKMLLQSLNNFWMNISKINFPYKTGYLP